MAELERIAGRVAEAIARAPDLKIDATSLTFLLRRYRDTDASSLRDALEPALARALEDSKAATTCRERAAWLTLFTDAAAISADDRLRDAIIDLVPEMRREWTDSRIVGDRALAIETCLNVVAIYDPRNLAPKAIDALEHLVAAAYRPGEGLAHELNEPGDIRGHLADQMHTASALLAAYMLTWRLPYGMLAEELVQHARRLLWDDQHSAFRESPVAGPDVRPFGLNCDAVRVLCRLAALHHDDDYRHVAVVAADTDYRSDAERILTAQSPSVPTRDLADAAAYGLALAEYVNLQ